MAEKPSFEKAIKELENIVTQLESDELALEKSIALFDQGTKLSKTCAEQLDQAQQKIEELMKKLASDPQS